MASPIMKKVTKLLSRNTLNDLRYLYSSSLLKSDSCFYTEPSLPQISNFFYTSSRSFSSSSEIKSEKETTENVESLNKNQSTEKFTENASEENTKNESTEKQERSKILVIGGNGFVGSEICKQAVSNGLNVMSLNRSGAPTIGESWVYDVDWIKGNAFEPEGWEHVLKNVSSVISCLGAFGSNEYMRKVNGDANITAIRLAHENGVKRFVYVSAHDFGFPSFVLRGYFEGKKAAEEALQIKFPYGGVILRPGMIHGVRRVGNMQLPLNLIGSPLESVLKNAKWASQIPIVGGAFIPPVSVDTVAKTALRAATDNAIPPGAMDVWSILRFGAN